jgi:hypothetical protein
VGSEDDRQSKTWDELVFERIEPGVDASIIRENLKLSPTERIEKMQRALALIGDLRNAYGNRPPSRPSGAR